MPSLEHAVSAFETKGVRSCCIPGHVKASPEALDKMSTYQPADIDGCGKLG